MMSFGIDAVYRLPGSSGVLVKLPIRACIIHDSVVALVLAPAELEIAPEGQTDGLPWLSGTFDHALPCRASLLLRLHNRAGIPIIEGRGALEAGAKRFIVNDLRALGIEAYAHAPQAQRLDVSRRIWSRCTYGTIDVQME